MITVYSDTHLLRNARTELYAGKLVPPHECPQRAQFVLDRVRDVRLGEIIAPSEHGMAPLLRVHDEAYVEFLANAWQEWLAAGYEADAIPDCWPARRMVKKCPTSIQGKLGYYAFAAETSINAGFWEAARAAADVALTATDTLNAGGHSAFALCRPPGHHAAYDLYGGYCFLNNAAIATQHLRDHGAARVAILDVDFHHGNGSQDIFYERSDVLFTSIHGDPAEAFPYFLGYADETGSGDGAGYNLNLPLPRGCDFGRWRAALELALARIRAFRPDAVVVSLGVDTYEDDPISFFKLKSDDFTTYGEMIGALKIPTLFVLEGGYAVAEVGVNVVNVLAGFERT